MDLRIYNMAEQFVFDSFNKAEKAKQIAQPMYEKAISDLNASPEI